MKRVIINKRRWLRGENQESYLLRSKDNKMCCIGFLARRLGCRRADIIGVGSLDAVVNETTAAFANDWKNTLTRAYEINDDPGLMDQERIKKLRQLGQEMGIQFIFK